VRALDAFENSVKHDSTSVKNWNKLANVAGMSKKYQRSIEACNAIVKLEPDDPHAYFMLRTSYLEIGDTLKAEENYRIYLDKGGKPLQ